MRTAAGRLCRGVQDSRYQSLAPDRLQDLCVRSGRGPHMCAQSGGVGRNTTLSAKPVLSGANINFDRLRFVPSGLRWARPVRRRSRSPFPSAQVLSASSARPSAFGTSSRTWDGLSTASPQSDRSPEKISESPVSGPLRPQDLCTNADRQARSAGAGPCARPRPYTLAAPTAHPSRAQATRLTSCGSTR